MGRMTPTLENVVGVQMSEHLEQPGDPTCPARLVAPTGPRSITSVEVLVEKDSVLPVRVILESLGSAIGWPASVFVAEEHTCSPTMDLVHNPACTHEWTIRFGFAILVPVK